MTRDGLIDQLTENNVELQDLRLRHRSLDLELSGLQSCVHLSDEQTWRIHELKKLKLMTKDRMESIIRDAQAR